jgi:hypothetical protein
MAPDTVDRRNLCIEEKIFDFLVWLKLAATLLVSRVIIVVSPIVSVWHLRFRVGVLHVFLEIKVALNCC